MDVRLGILLFARMSSQRLPGKMLLPLGPTTLLERVVRRASLLEFPIVMATSDDPSDDPLVDAARGLGVTVFRGSLDDVLARAVGAAQSAGFDAFARLCGDRPFLPVDDMQAGLEVMRQSFVRGTPLDLVTSELPRRVPPGMLTEIVRTQALAALNAGDCSAYEREHVTVGFHARAQAHRILALQTPLQELAGVHLSVDTDRDRQLLGDVIRAWPALDLPAAAAADGVRRLMHHESMGLASAPMPGAGS